MTPKEGKTQCVKNKACFALGNRELKRERENSDSFPSSF